jgi:hypothetical protein
VVGGLSACAQARRWLPSQSGLLPVCLQTQNQASPAVSGLYSTGASPVPLWLPSQKGCEPLRPQAHHQYDLPASTSTFIGARPATIGVSGIPDLLSDATARAPAADATSAGGATRAPRVALVLTLLVAALPAWLAACAAPPSCVGLSGSPMLSAELFFGRAQGDEAAWRDFLARSVTPRFPAGFTEIDGSGQWRGRASGEIVAEPSTVLIVEAAPGAATLAALEAIRADYRHRFVQESVGLALTESCASF